MVSEQGCRIYDSPIMWCFSFYDVCFQFVWTLIKVWRIIEYEWTIHASIESMREIWINEQWHAWLYLIGIEWKVKKKWMKKNKNHSCALNLLVCERVLPLCERVQVGFFTWIANRWLQAFMRCTVVNNF